MAQATTTPPTTPPPSPTNTREPVSGTARALEQRRRRPFWLELYRSAVGKKYVMAITGIIGMAWLAGHAIGNLKMYLGPADFNAYGEWLRSLLVPFFPRTITLWLIRIGVIIAVLLHIHAAYGLTVMNRKARVVHYQSKRDYVAADYASRTMRWSGVIVGLFILFHLVDLTWTGSGYHFHRGDVYGNVAQSLDRPVVAAIYIVANLALGLHLYHGAWSLFQSMGWNQPRFNRWRRWFAATYATAVAGTMISFPVFVLAGVVHNPGSVT